MGSNKHYCRFCAQTFSCSKRKLIDLNNSETLEHYKNIFSLLNVNFIDLGSESLPKTVCNPCSDTIDKSYTFFEKAKKAQDLLVDIFKIKNEVQIKMESFEAELHDIHLDLRNIIYPNSSETDNTVLQTLKNETEVESDKVEDDFIEDIPLSDREDNVDESEDIKDNNSDNETKIQKACDSISSNKRKSAANAKKRKNRSKEDSVYVDNSNGNSSKKRKIIANEKKLKKRSTEDSDYVDNSNDNSSKKGKFIASQKTLKKTSEEDSDYVDNSNDNSSKKRKFIANEKTLKKTSEEDSDYVNNSNDDSDYVNNSNDDSDFDIDTLESSKAKTCLSKKGKFIKNTVKQVKTIKKVKYDSDQNISTTIKGEEKDKKEDKKKKDLSMYNSENEDYSWTDYEWYCWSCNEKFENTNDLRDHSKAVHNLCFSFKCVDCRDEFNIFGNFVEHVRIHRPCLRKYCYICNEKFTDATACHQHSLEHWTKDPMCGLCAEKFPDDISFQRHKAAYKRRPISKSCRRKFGEIKRVKQVEYDLSKSWKDYDWICTYCYLKAPNVEALRQHSREVHKECFSMKCADCFKVSIHFKIFVKHVQLHRPHLVRYCHHCDYYCVEEELQRHIEAHTTSSCLSCGETLQDEQQLFNHIKEYDVNIQATKDNWACQLCSKTFMTSQRLRTHLNTHRDRTREHVCEECGASFIDKSNFLAHRKIHKPSEVACMICKYVFKSEINLKKHVKYSHLSNEKISCTECEKSFSNQRNLKRHLRVHSAVAQYKCEYCGKAFKRKQHLNIHLCQHTGIRPYSCKFCDRTFTTWGNCDKHMVLRHKTSLAKRRRTPYGLVVLDETGALPSMEDAKEWTDELFKKSRKSKIIPEKP